MKRFSHLNARGEAIYDMCKALDKTMRITDIVLVSKTKK